ncbi:MAG: hypothetical protein KBD37_04600 [Burkholderiales bacterium]|nr:hypothetical protein [Burkholderiales bacterium]
MTINIDRAQILSLNPFRRLAEVTEIKLTAEDFCQSYDVNVDANQKKIILGNDKTHYYMHTIGSLLSDIEQNLKLGITKICISPNSNPDLPTEKKLELFSQVIIDIRQQFGNTIKITIDPAAVGMHSDLKWGLKNNIGEIDPLLSLKLVGDAAVAFVQAGADEFLTIGRINFEVREVFNRLKKERLNAKIISFSSNPDTVSAYINVTQHNLKKSNTGQKIIVGNIDEMVLRSLIDFAEGCDTLIQKPMNGCHIISTIKAILCGEISLDKFLNRAEIQRLVSQNELFLLPMLNDLKINFENIKTHKKYIGAYAISGSYAVYRLIEQHYSTALAIAFLHEEYINMKASAGELFNMIIDRNACWYLKNRNMLQ